MLDAIYSPPKKKIWGKQSKIKYAVVHGWTICQGGKRLLTYQLTVVCFYPTNFRKEDGVIYRRLTWPTVTPQNARAELSHHWRRVWCGASAIKSLNVSVTNSFQGKQRRQSGSAEGWRFYWPRPVLITLALSKHLVKHIVVYKQTTQLIINLPRPTSPTERC